MVGATLWTNLDSAAKQAVAEEGMNDFRRIYVREPQEHSQRRRLLRAADVLNWHRVDRDWLRQEIAHNASINRPVVVISHHLPTFSLIDSKYAADPCTVAFASDCRELLTHPVRAWIAGHTHTAARCASGGVQLGVNPRGYPGDSHAQSGYSPDLCMFVDSGA